MQEQWPRALLRATLIEAGYDAIGARTCEEALRTPVAVADRGPVRLLLIDAAVLRTPGNCETLARRMTGAARVLIAPAAGPRAPNSWNRIIRRPTSIGDVVREIQSLVPLGESATGSV